MRTRNEYYNIDEIGLILGGDYLIFRLRKEAFLDHELELAWNCVAVPIGTQFEEILKPRIVKSCTKN